jgi:uncharacterized protein YqeY
MPKLFETLQADLIVAQKARDAETVGTLRLMISEAKNAKIRLMHELSDEETQAVLRAEVKKRKDAIEQFEKGGRQDLADADKKQIAIIEKYLPAQMSAADVEAKVAPLVTPDMTMKDMGKLMGAAMKATAGKADGKVVNEIVKKLLSQNSNNG